MKEEKKTELRLRLWEELEVWQQEDNHLIETGYREASGSFIACFHSLTYIHNETVNIYLHLIGAVLFAALPLYLFQTEIPPRYLVATPEDIIVCSIYFTGVATCFALSALYHTLISHSHESYILGAQLDYAGVNLLMWSANIVLIFYGFPCDVELRWDYWKLLSGLAIACSISTFHHRFQDPYLRPVRAATFGSLALCTMLPVFHGIYKYGWHLQNQRMGIKWVIITLVLNVGGAAAYALKIPERWCKRRFDILGASHQIFHLFTLLAALTFTRAILQAFDFSHAHAHDESCQL